MFNLRRDGKAVLGFEFWVLGFGLGNCSFGFWVLSFGLGN